MLHDELAEDVKDDLLMRPNFPGAPRQKPYLPPRGPVEHLAEDRVVYEKRADHPGAMVALRIPPVAARLVALDVPGAEPASDLHVTLVYLGDAGDLDPDALQRLHDNLSRVAATTGPVAGRLAGAGRFSQPDADPPEDVLWVTLDSPDLPELRHRVLQAVRDAAIEPAGDHGFTPHVALAYVAPGEAEDPSPPDVPVTVRWLSLVVGGREVAIRLKGSDRDDDRPQRALPERTFSATMAPKVGDLTTIEQLEEWAQGRGDLVVRADVAGPDCIVVKKGGDVRVAVRGWGGEEVRLDDLVSAMRRVDHDYILCGRLQAQMLDGGRWVSDPDDLEEVLRAREVGMPTLLPCDLLALDGDLTDRPARERWEMMRAMVPVAGGHVVVPMQKVCRTDEDLEACVDEVMRWRPADLRQAPRAVDWPKPGARGDLEPTGVTCVPADSPYVHGETDLMARLTLRGVEKAAVGEEDDAVSPPEYFRAQPLPEAGYFAAGAAVVELSRAELPASGRLPAGGPSRLARDPSAERVNFMSPGKA